MGHTQPRTPGWRGFTLSWQSRLINLSRVHLHSQMRSVLSSILAVDVYPHSSALLHFLCAEFLPLHYHLCNSYLALTSINALEDFCTKQAPVFCYSHGSQSLIKGKEGGGEALGAKIWNRKNTGAGCFKTHIAHSCLL